MTEVSIQMCGLQESPYSKDGVALRVMRESCIDFTGDRLTSDGKLERESATDAVLRMADIVRANYPEGIGLLRNVGLEIE